MYLSHVEMSPEHNTFACSTHGIFAVFFSIPCVNISPKIGDFMGSSAMSPQCSLDSCVSMIVQNCLENGSSHLWHLEMISLFSEMMFGQQVALYVKMNQTCFSRGENYSCCCKICVRQGFSGIHPCLVAYFPNGWKHFLNIFVLVYLHCVF